MASSDEEGEIIPSVVNDYWFENENDGFAPLSSLTLLWSTSDEISCSSGTKVYLRGTADDGLQKVHKQIIGWRFELSNEQQPEISVLLKDKNRITLQRPRKCFESAFRTVLVTVSWLHAVKWNPEKTGVSIWNKIMKAFSSFDVMPSENDLINHMSMIREAAKRDADFAKSKYLLNFIGEGDSNELFHEDVRSSRKPKFIIDSEEEESDKSDGELGVNVGQSVGYDTVCAICDNGGEILPCEGRCLRSFHPTIEDGKDSLCDSLGFTKAQVTAFPNFYCENCKNKKHQCFACGNLGSSDESSNAEVFPCITANCGQHYHPACVARLLYPGIDAEQQERRKRVVIDKTFICPLHICTLCRKGENRNVHDLQFAVCRRCPKAYHRKCLPKEIPLTFDYEKGIPQRAWDNLLDRRILMYCMDHEIVPELGTPARNHLVFPYNKVKEKKQGHKLFSKEKDAILLRKSFEDLPHKKSLATKLVTRESMAIQNDSSTKVRDNEKGLYFSHGSLESVASGKYVKDEKKSLSGRSLPSIGSKLILGKDNTHKSSRIQQAVSLQRKLVSQRTETRSLDKPLGKKVKTSPDFIQADMEKEILSLVKESMSTVNEEEFKKNNQCFGSSTCFTETGFDKSLTLGKVEGSVKAIQTALQKLDEGCSIEDAKAICEPGILHQLFIWQQLKVYLAPFLHGMRYTSFGRHFTKIDKLKEIVDRLHWYVQNGDMVLDFCCGSNDFSCLMKSKLEQMGKPCLFKNYDLIQAKNDFSFEKRDWMSVTAEELPNGSQLIIGLNPPFGVNGYLANKFIDKALTFKPKLLVLIVPKVTKRLDRKKGGYDLIWEDDEMLSGKAFYLPGSVDVRDKQLEDWNNKTPPLYLWSRPDWSARHRAIALQHGHIKDKYDDAHVKGIEVKNYLMEENHDCYQDYAGLHAPGDVLSIFDGVPDDNGGATPEEGGNSFGHLKEMTFPASVEADSMAIDMDLSSP
ncbi:protein ENHANCED DOWNY MILDEW 2 isoform X2 [Arachis duranensis]|uniref:Protein ENHANCED DOWNY MILDEW 2 isoform X2 n=1 Tax=Arachis duranensis TaxID=130453 RepID=A0A9C6TDN2_ARADU|nr:protein ENHANCED DOWNY MILDEW 2 isoform X2 [Arachis duranensis]